MNIKLTSVTKEFIPKVKKGEEKKVVLAIDNIDMDIEDGKITTLIGPAGAGKTTILNLISGLIAPTSGSILFNDKDMKDVKVEDRNVGMVFQNNTLYPHLSVLENIKFPLLSKKMNKKEADALARELANELGLTSILDKYPSELTNGEAIATSLARAVIKKPDILLLDEPLANLDSKAKDIIKERIRELQQKYSLTVLYVTADQTEGLSMANSVIVIRDGDIQQCGTPQEIYDEPANRFVAKFIGDLMINMIPCSYIDETDTLTFGSQEFLDEKNPLFGERMVLTKDTQLGIRPEFIKIDYDGKYTMHIEKIEYVGRDKIVTFTLPEIEDFYKCVIPSDMDLEIDSDIKFDLKKYFMFDYIGRRLR